MHPRCLQPKRKPCTTTLKIKNYTKSFTKVFLMKKYLLGTLQFGVNMEIFLLKEKLLCVSYKTETCSWAKLRNVPTVEKPLKPLTI